MDIKTLDDTYVAHTYGRIPLTIVGGKGSELYGEDGRTYIDLGSGIAVNTFGTADEEWIRAVTAQLGRVQHTSNYYYTEPCARLAEMLCARTGMKRVFFSNSGAEANECAIKAARRRAFLKYGDESHATVITLKSSFHGRTMATLAATGQDGFHTEFGPMPGGFVYASATDAEDVRRLAEENSCCAILMELVQGEGGVNRLAEDYVQKVAAIAKEKDLLLMIDEVQTGNGRTGKLYAYMHYGIVPDVVTTAKGLAGGLPLGATLLGEKAQDAFAPGKHGSTFGGNPVAAAGAVSVLSRLDESLLSEVKKKAAYIRKRLEKAPGVKAVTGLGLMVGIVCDMDAHAVMDACRERGVLVLTAKERVRLVPPLNIPDVLLEKAMDVLVEVLSSGKK